MKKLQVLFGCALGLCAILAPTMIPSDAVASNDSSTIGTTTGTTALATGLVIDIKPRSERNPINLRSRGVIPVAILGSELFDVTTIDGSTLAFGPSGAGIAHRNGPHFGDVNDDGHLDLVAHFRTQQTGIQKGDTEACLTGQTIDGMSVCGCDTIVTVGKKN